MQMSVTYAQITAPRWVSFISNHPSATSFHHPAWSNLLAECYGYRPFVVAVADDGGQIVAGTPLMEIASPFTGKRWVSLPFTDYCRPLAESEMALDALADRLLELCETRQVPRIEVRWALPARQDVYPISDSVLHTLSLSSDPDAVFQTFKKTRVQQCIVRSQREGVVVRWGKSKIDMDVFYRLHWQTRRRHGTPVQPKRYFDLLWERLLTHDPGFILLAYKDSQPVAGAVFLTWNDVLTYKYSASDSAYWRLRPNHLILWTAIRWGCESGYRLFDFGKSEIANQGLRDFKSGWGTEETPLTYSYIGAAPPDHTLGFKEKAMSAVIRYSPPIVCRAVGELLYGHFG